MKTSEAKKRTEELNRLAAVEEENVRMGLLVAEQRAEIAKLSREKTNLQSLLTDARERLMWVARLANSSDLRPRQLPDSKPPEVL